MTAVVPLGKATFELFDEDREVKEAVAIGLQESLDLIGAIWLLPQVSELLIEGLATRWTVAGLDAFRVARPQRALGPEVLRTADGSD